MAGVPNSFMSMSMNVVNGSFVHFACTWCPADRVPGEIYPTTVIVYTKFHDRK